MGSCAGFVGLFSMAITEKPSLSPHSSRDPSCSSECPHSNPSRQHGTGTGPPPLVNRSPWQTVQRPPSARLWNGKTWAMPYLV